MPELEFTPTAAADYIGIHVSTLKRWAREGRIAGFRTPGGHWKFTQADLDAFIAAGRTEPEPAA